MRWTPIEEGEILKRPKPTTLDALSAINTQLQNNNYSTISLNPELAKDIDSKSRPSITEPPEPPKARKIKEGKQPEPPKPRHQFKIHRSNFGWVVSERKKTVKARWLRSDVVTWSYKTLNKFGEFMVPMIDTQHKILDGNRMHNPFKTKEKAQEWLTGIIKERKEAIKLNEICEGDVLFFNESDLI